MPEHHMEEPYPLLQISGKNPEYAYAMLGNVGGKNSEMSAVASYFYSHIVTAEHADVARAFHTISIAEMHHLEIFATLTRLLGADPRLWERQRGLMRYWSPGYIHYPRRVDTVLRNALKEERDAIRKYEHQAKTIADPHIVQALERVLRDEESHVKTFERLLRQFI
ncbi:MAG: manganese catalase family protein [Christensenellaceae bacterium]|jgi:bacterioferritin|nr:manganese catalase family protein [Christensenellaceae bacterium]